MLKPEQIPRAAAIAATRDGLSSDDVREIVAAAINAWPGMERERIGKGYEWPLTEEYTDTIILPLPTEASDDR